MRQPRLVHAWAISCKQLLHKRIVAPLELLLDDGAHAGTSQSKRHTMGATRGHDLGCRP